MARHGIGSDGYTDTIWVRPAQHRPMSSFARVTWSVETTTTIDLHPYLAASSLIDRASPRVVLGSGWKQMTFLPVNRLNGLVPVAPLEFPLLQGSRSRLGSESAMVGATSSGA